VRNRRVEIDRPGLGEHQDTRRRGRLRTRGHDQQRVAGERPIEDRITPGCKIDNQPATVKHGDRCADLPEVAEVVLERLGDRVESRLDTAVDLQRTASR
jgi:hypothetical protein